MPAEVNAWSVGRPTLQVTIHGSAVGQADPPGRTDTRSAPTPSGDVRDGIGEGLRMVPEGRTIRITRTRTIGIQIGPVSMVGFRSFWCLFVATKIGSEAWSVGRPTLQVTIHGGAVD